MEQVIPETEVELQEPGESESFDTLGMSEEVLRAVHDAGYRIPTPIQREAIPLILRGRDVIGLAQTGTGKTAAFTLPLVDQLLRGPRRTRAVVLTPTRELCLQVRAEHSEVRAARDALGRRGVRRPYRSSPRRKALAWRRRRRRRDPGPAIDHLERQNVVRRSREVLVLDEADRMLDGLRPAINRLVAEMPRYRQTLLFSATRPPEVEALARKYLRKRSSCRLGVARRPAETVTHAVYPVPRERKSALLAHLLKDGELDSVLVFVRTKIGADRA